MSERSEHVRALPCDPCVMEKMSQPFPTEEHHQNLGGYAGKKRLGDAYSAPCCGWHHRGLLLPGFSSTRMDELYGPSLALSSRRFRATYGTDAEMLARTNKRLSDGFLQMQTGNLA